MCVSGCPYRLSPRAQADLEDIWLYTLETWSIEQADKYVDQIVAVIDQLARGMIKGRAIDLRAGYFKCPAGAHFVFYKQSSSSLDVIRILHQRMDAEARL